MQKFAYPYCIFDLPYACVNAIIVLSFITVNPSVEFEQTVYTVLEDEGILQVCAVVSEKTVSEQIHLTIYTEDDTAQGTCNSTNNGFL